MKEKKTRRRRRRAFSSLCLSFPLSLSLSLSLVKRAMFWVYFQSVCCFVIGLKYGRNISAPFGLMRRTPYVRKRSILCSSH